MSFLYNHMRDMQRMIRDSNQMEVDPGDLITYVNKARRQVAQQAQCIRRLCPSSGSVTTATITAAGAHYAATTTFAVSAPDFPSGAGAYPAGRQATVTGQVVNGALQNVSINDGGEGYFSPSLTITDPTGAGSGATVTLGISPITSSVANKEVYKFTDFPLTNFPGVAQILAVKSVSFIYANFRYSLPCYSWSEYQAKIRQYPQQYLYVPTMCAQYGQGTDGSLYFYPIPSTIYQFEVDCICLPQDLLQDNDVEAIPYPWIDAVPFLGTYYCFLELQQLNAAKFYFEQYMSWMHMHGVGARPGRAVNPYGRY